MKIIRPLVSANLMLLFVFALLPVLFIKPDIEVIQSLLAYINKE
ncbi:Uncharacterised protein [Sporosarcina pasteurii]|uniref:Uncharacterized protein n=1 Tax=Sporosarcina pasteurii TaxID=1474 RepID=A0A380C725_SPOPA|nr:Uncharacterised protein [Sporosarcina pasteurii]